MANVYLITTVKQGAILKAYSNASKAIDHLRHISKGTFNEESYGQGVWKRLAASNLRNHKVITAGSYKAIPVKLEK